MNLNQIIILTLSVYGANALIDRCCHHHHHHHHERLDWCGNVNDPCGHFPDNHFDCACKPPRPEPVPEKPCQCYYTPYRR
ncbi:MAG: hypothetical protein IKC33_04285 [Clostridia bacterium]|nr:hypothetical protein [Clostridia bacterium]